MVLDNFFSSFISFSKKGSVDGFEKVIMGFIILVILFAISPVIFGGAFLGDSTMIESFPDLWVPIILVGLIIGVIALIRR